MSKFFRVPSFWVKSILVIGAACNAIPASAQLRVGCWNVSFWRASEINTARINAFKTVLYSSYQGRTFAPDILLIQEVYTAADLATFKTLMNTATGSPGDWETATFVTGPDSQSSMLYRTSKVDIVNVIAPTTPVPTTLTGDSFIASLGSTNTSLPPRHGIRHIVRPKGYVSQSAAFAMYNLHMKSSSDSASQARRQIEAQRIVADAATLPANVPFLVAGDFNIQSSSQAAYGTFVGTTAIPGPLFDPIKTPGSWNNNNNFRFVHTQDPGGGIPGGSFPGYMDDRLDFILLSAGLVNGAGMDYIGNSNVAYSTSTWNDANHSYRVWGNDGTTFNQAVNPATNTMTGPLITQAILDTLVNGAGHLPLFLDLKVPPKASVSTVSLDFGFVRVETPFTLPIVVTNSGNTALWTANGIANLSYTFTPSTTFSVSAGAGSDSATPGGNTHQIVFVPSVAGRFSETITLNTNDPDMPTITINCTGVGVRKITRNPR